MNCKNCGAPIGVDYTCHYCGSYYGEIRQDIKNDYDVKTVVRGGLGNKVLFVDCGAKSWGVAAATSALAGVITLN